MKLFKFTFPEWAGELEKFLHECKFNVDQLVYEALQHFHDESIKFTLSLGNGLARQLVRIFHREMEAANDRLRLLEQRVEQLELQRTSVISAEILARVRAPAPIPTPPRPLAPVAVLRARRCPETVAEREARLHQ